MRERKKEREGERKRERKREINHYSDMKPNHDVIAAHVISGLFNKEVYLMMLLRRKYSLSIPIRALVAQ